MKAFKGSCFVPELSFSLLRVGKVSLPRLSAVDCICTSARDHLSLYLFMKRAWSPRETKDCGGTDDSVYADFCRRVKQAVSMKFAETIAEVFRGKAPPPTDVTCCRATDRQSGRLRRNVTQIMHQVDTSRRKRRRSGMMATLSRRKATMRSQYNFTSPARPPDGRHRVVALRQRLLNNFPTGTALLEAADVTWSNGRSAARSAFYAHGVFLSAEHVGRLV